MAKRDEFTVDVFEKLGVLSVSVKGWSKELRRVSWNGNDTKFDIRSWHANGEKEDYSKGITLTDDEAKLLIKALAKYFKENDEDTSFEKDDCVDYTEEYLQKYGILNKN